MPPATIEESTGEVATCGDYDIIADQAAVSGPGYGAIVGTAGGDVYVAIPRRGLLHRSSGGGWISSFNFPNITALSASGEDIFAATEQGGVLHLSGAAVWNDGVPTASAIVSVAAVSAVEVYAVSNSADGAHVLHTRDAGANWTDTLIGYGLRQARVNRIWARSASDVYAVVDSAPGMMPWPYVYHSAGDDRWTSVADGLGMRTLDAVWGVGETTYIGGRGDPFWAGRVLGGLSAGQWIDDGVPYGRPDSPDLPGIVDIWGDLNSPLFAVATGNIAQGPVSLLLGRCQRQGWTRLFPDLGTLTSVWGPPGGSELYAVGDSIHHFRILRHH